MMIIGNKKLLLAFLAGMFKLSSIIAIQPSARELFIKANTCAAENRLTEAIILYQDALAIEPTSVEIHYNLATALKASGHLDDAIEHYQQALSVKPGHEKIHTDLADCYAQQKDFEKALYHCKRAIEKNPTNHELLYSLGLYLVKLDKLEQACTVLKKLLVAVPNSTETMCNLGYALNRLNKHTEAAEYYRRAIVLKPDNNRAHLALAFSYLATGNLEQGWEEFEYRFANAEKCHNTLNYLHLTPASLAGKRVELHAEWGIGDMVQFIRYAKLIKEHGGTVILQAFDPIKQLLTSCPYIDTVISIDEAYQPADLHIPYLSLPRLFKTTLQTIPADIPYLYADANLVEQWKGALAPDKKFKIGICWHAKPIFLEDHMTTRRSIPLEAFIPLLQCQGASFYSLQKIHGEDELTSTPELSSIHTFADFDESHGRFMDTAALIQNLDLVISADTSIVHIAGALGAQVWVLLPYCAEWRWLHDRNDTHWYPHTMRLFRQPSPGNWHSVIQEVKEALEQRIVKKRSTHLR